MAVGAVGLVVVAMLCIEAGVCGMAIGRMVFVVWPNAVGEDKRITSKTAISACTQIRRRPDR